MLPNKQKKDQGARATATLSRQSIMQKPNVSQSNREALKLILTPSDFAIKFSDKEMPFRIEEGQGATATITLPTKSIMQKPSLKEDVSQSSREALNLILTPSDFAIKFPDKEMPVRIEEGQGVNATTTLSTNSIMQNANLNDDVPLSNREASTSSSGRTNWAEYLMSHSSRGMTMKDRTLPTQALFA
jgi:hypothetical protein